MFCCANTQYIEYSPIKRYYKKFVKSLKSKGFNLNPYDPWVANKEVNGEQLTVCFHVDNCKVLHLIPKVVDETMEWLRTEYDNVFKDKTGQMKVHCGKTHKYMGMSLDFSHSDQCRVTIIDCVDEIVVAYDKALKDLSDGFSAVTNTKKKNVARTSVAPDDLFITGEDAKKLSEEGTKAFQNLVAKTLYIIKHARRDVSTTIAFLTTRVGAPDINDWRKLSCLMEYLRVDRLYPLILSANGSVVLMWYVDASFAVHPNLRSHTGGGLTVENSLLLVLPSKS